MTLGIDLFKLGYNLKVLTGTHNSPQEKLIFAYIPRYAFLIHQVCMCMCRVIGKVAQAFNVLWFMFAPLDMESEWKGFYVYWVSTLGKERARAKAGQHAFALDSPFPCEAVFYATLAPEHRAIRVHFLLATH